MVRTGLARLVEADFAPLRGKRVGWLMNQATILADGRHLLEILDRSLIARVFGPQHGLWGHTQDNMIEWQGAVDPRLGVEMVSLYGESRQPKPEQIADLDVVVVDLPDIGSRYYTFAWSMALTMEVCAQVGVPMLILDRPNPLGGVVQEGPEIEPGYRSFVGWHSLPIRHGRTLGELAQEFAERYYPAAEVEVLECQGWERDQLYPANGLPWALPSPNMPSFATALVYPGACLLEGTVLSEGRGTTRPFEQFGAPWLDGWAMAAHLNGLDLDGVWFRPTQFQPTFHKYGGELCEGVFVHVRDAESFRSVRAYVEAIRYAYAVYAEIRPGFKFQPAGEAGAWAGDQQGFWKLPPYEYEYELPPIDILWGSPALREAVEAGKLP